MSHDYMFVFITETWLKPLYPDSFLVNTNNFNVMRKDRLNSRGGGVCVIFNSSLASKISLVDTDAENCIGFEILAFDFYFSSYKKCRFVCVYLPPSRANDCDTVQALLIVLKNLSTSSELYILGDFNFSNVRWNNLCSTNIGQTFNNFKHFLNVFNLTQMITFPTHVQGNTLDLLITSKPQNIISLNQREPFTMTCDHNMIEFKLHQAVSKCKKTAQKRNFYRGNYDKINKFLLNVDWDQIFAHSSNIDEIYSLFISNIHASITQFVPLINTNRKPYIPKQIKNLLHLKNLLYKRTKLDSSIKPLYKELCHVYKVTVSNFYINKERNVLCSSNKKSFFGYINRKLKSKSQLPPLVNDNNEIVMDPLHKAELLNAQFTSVFKKDDGSVPPISYSGILKNISFMDDFEITVQHVNKAISSLKSSVSTTPDKIPSLFIIKTLSSLSKPLSILYNISIKQGTLPDLWKTAIITPIHKKGPKNTAANYRPISLTSVLCRILEHIIHEQMTFHLMKNQLISHVQHGFVKSRSSLTQHLTFLNELTTNFENNISSDVIYLDFSKAFDSVPHNKLLYVLKNLKIDHSILIWIEKYLLNRCQRTQVDGILSKPSKVTSGVPQGSVLGPLLFILFLEDLIRRLECMDRISVYVFADDMKILSCDPSQLQFALYVVEEWSINWQLRIQPTKSEHITFSRQSPPISCQYFINRLAIPHTLSVKDLGLHISSNFKWQDYVSKIYAKSIHLVYLIIKSFTFKNPHFYINLFKLYIRPNLEYNVSAWLPYQTGNIKKIESVQATFTRMVCRKLNIKYDSYHHRLQMFNLDTLETRRIKYDLILIYKIVNKLVDLHFNDFFSISPTLKLYSLRRHSLHLQKPKMPKTAAKLNFFTHRTINIWNQLPKDVVTANSLMLFKLRLNKVNFNSLYVSKL